MTGNVADNVTDNSGQWMTYSELAQRLGVTLEAAKRRAARGGWSRRLHNEDGRARVLVPGNVTHNVPHNAQQEVQDQAPSVTPAVAALAAALEAARETAGRQEAELQRLRDALRTAEVEAATGRGEVRRLDEMVVMLKRELDRLHEAQRLIQQSRARSLVDRIKALFASPS